MTTCLEADDSIEKYHPFCVLFCKQVVTIMGNTNVIKYSCYQILDELNLSKLN